MTKAVKSRKTGRHRGRVFLACWVLCICFFATLAYVAGIINTSTDSRQGQIIQLVSDKVKNNNEENTNESQLENVVDKGKIKDFDFQTGDDTKVWSTNTKVDIFHLTYKNNEGVITVNSDKGKEVIAPGTENIYDFTLKNNGNIAVDYKMNVKAYVTPDDISIPVYARLSRYDNKWLLGSKENYSPVLKLNGVNDASALEANSFAEYSLQWQWPFEQGDDEYDTLLGDRAVNEDITLTVEIETVAVADYSQQWEQSNKQNGTTPQTGDNSNLYLYIALMAGAIIVLIVIIILWFKKGREKEDEISFEEKTEK